MTQKVENLVWKRGAAVFFDHLIITFVCIIILMPTLVNLAQTMKTPEEIWPLILGSIYTIPAVIVIVIFVIFYEPFCTYRYGWTLGKRMCNLKVVDDQGKQLDFGVSFLRFLAKSACMALPYISLIILLICYLRVRKGEKALWDQWVETNVVQS